MKLSLFSLVFILHLASLNGDPLRNGILGSIGGQSNLDPDSSADNDSLLKEYMSTVARIRSIVNAVDGEIDGMITDLRPLNGPLPPNSVKTVMRKKKNLLIAHAKFCLQLLECYLPFIIKSSKTVAIDELAKAKACVAMKVLSLPVLIEEATKFLGPSAL